GHQQRAARRRRHGRTVARVGGQPPLRLLGRRHQLLPGSPASRRRAPSGAGPARGDGRVDGRRARQVHRRGGRGDQHPGPGSGPPAQRAVRRQARPRARGGHRRSAADQRAGLGVPAGDRPPEPVQGRLRAVHLHGPRARAGGDGAGPRVPDRAGDPVALRRGRAARRPAGAGARRSAAGARGDGHRRRVQPAARRTARGGPAARGRRAQRRGAGGAARRAGRAGRGRGGPRGRRAARRRRDHEPARQAVVGRVAALELRGDGPPGHHRLRAADGVVRHAAAGRHQRPLDRVLPAAGAGPCGAGRPRRPPPRQPLPGRGGAHRRRRRHPLGPAPAARGASLHRLDRAGARLGGGVARPRRGAGGHGGRPAQPRARRAPALRPPARRRARQRRRRVHHLLVRPPPPAAHRGAGAPVLDPGHHGLRPAVRRRRQALGAGPARRGARGRRRDADERHRRARHGRAPLAGLGRPAPGRAGARQPRPRRGHVGAARDRGRPPLRREPGHPGLPLRGVRRAAGAARDQGDGARRGGRRLGAGAGGRPAHAHRGRDGPRRAAAPAVPGGAGQAGVVPGRPRPGGRGGRARPGAARRAGGHGGAALL
ncbi:MAG: Thiamine pyrophosphate-requiring protein PA2108, partial [uncultured Nocardioides sp.]